MLTMKLKMCAVELHTEVINGGVINIFIILMMNERNAQRTPLSNLAQCRSRIVRLANNQYVANRDKLHSIWNGTMKDSLMVIK